MRLRRLEPVLRRALGGPCAIPRGAILLVAVSGGADSTALLLGLHRIAHEFDLGLHAAHLHHGLRGAAADRDLAFVRDLCGRLEVSLTAARWNAAKRMRRRRLSGEGGLRILRREFLLAAARRAGANAIATAHTADDQLETMLLRLLRGTGLCGLGGMSPRTGPWIKPLLEATRAAIVADLSRAEVPWREDRSNQDLRHARNRVRHVAIPALIQAMGPEIDPSIARAGLLRRAGEAAREAREAGRVIQRWTSRLLSRFCRIQGDVATLDREALALRPAALRIAVLRSAWKRLQPDNGLTQRNLRDLSRLLQRPRGASRVELHDGWRAVADRDHLVIARPRLEPAPAPLRLRVPGRVSWSRCKVSGTWTSPGRARNRLSRQSPNVEYFAAEGIEGDLEVRSARADERFVPFGRVHPVRIAEFVRKQSIGRERRLRPAVLADRGGILWVIGVRRSARAPVLATTRRALRVDAESHD